MPDRDYDPDFERLLPLLPTVADFSTTEAIQELRAQRMDLLGELPPDREDVEKQDRAVPGRAVAGRVLPGRDGDPDVPVRIYTPVAGTAPRGCVLEIHGGGFMTGNIEMMDAWCQVVAGELGCVVVSVEYRLAPEHPFPAGLEDCYAVLCWAASNADELGIDRERIAVAGQSAGGGLAAATALLARDRGGPPLCFQLLEIPELDDRLDTPSMKAFVDTPLWNRPNAVWSWRHYLGPDHTGEVSPYAAPARSTDLSGLPPAYVSTMEFDPLRDEGIEYGLRLLQAGVSVELHSFRGTFHGSALLPSAAVSRRNSLEVMASLERALRG